MFFANPGALSTPTYLYAAEGSYTATVTVADSVGDARQTSFDIQVDLLTSPGLQAFLAKTPDVTIYADSTTNPADVVRVVNDLTGIVGPVSVTLELGGATFAVSDLMYNPGNLASAANVNFIIQNGALVSANSGLTVNAGILTIRDCTLESAGTTLTVNGGQASVLDCTLLTTGNARGNRKESAHEKCACHRPGCYRRFTPPLQSPLKKFCNARCRKALRRVILRERKWLARLSLKKNHARDGPYTRAS